MTVFDLCVCVCFGTRRQSVTTWTMAIKWQEKKKKKSKLILCFIVSLCKSHILPTWGSIVWTIGPMEHPKTVCLCLVRAPSPRCTRFVIWSHSRRRKDKGVFPRCGPACLPFQISSRGVQRSHYAFADNKGQFASSIFVPHKPGNGFCLNMKRVSLWI